MRIPISASCSLPPLALNIFSNIVPTHAFCPSDNLRLAYHRYFPSVYTNFHFMAKPHERDIVHFDQVVQAGIGDVAGVGLDWEGALLDWSGNSWWLALSVFRTAVEARDALVRISYLAAIAVVKGMVKYFCCLPDICVEVGRRGMSILCTVLLELIEYLKWNFKDQWKGRIRRT